MEGRGSSYVSPKQQGLDSIQHNNLISRDGNSADRKHCVVPQATEVAFWGSRAQNSSFVLVECFCPVKL